MTQKTPPPPPSDTASDKAPDLAALASRTLDLWQDQIGRLSQDPATLDLMTRTFAMMTRGGAALQDMPFPFGPVSGETPPDGHTRSTATPSTTPSQSRPASGSPPPADVSGDGSDVVAGLLRRIADLEERVHTLESRHAGGDAKPARRRKPG